MRFLIFLAFYIVGANCQTTFDNAFMIFVGDNKNDYLNVSKTSDISKLRGALSFVGLTYGKYYNPNRPTVIYANGWRSTYESEDSDAIINAYLSKKQFNIIYIDWYNYTNNFAYVTSLGAIEGVSLTIYKIMDRLRSDKLINFDMKNIHLIGFSLGAHLANHIARQIETNNLFFLLKVSQLTGLDPAGLFKYGDFLFPFFNVETFRNGHADFTACVHTSAGKFGLSSSTGIADFWMNGGETQVGCSAKKSIQEFLADQDINKIDRLACSHRRAWEYYVESILSPKGAFQCNLCKSGAGLKGYFNTTTCPDDATNSINMGYYAKDGFKSFFSIDYYCPTSDGSSGKYSLT